MKHASLFSICASALLWSALTVSFLTSPDAQACHGGDGRHPPECGKQGKRPPPPPPCNIPDNRYYLSGTLNDDLRYSVTLWMKHGHPVLLIEAAGQEYLAAAIKPFRGPGHPGPRNGSKNHGSKHQGFENQGLSQNEPRHERHERYRREGKARKGHPRHVRACKNDELHFQWEPSQSVPKGVGGEIKFKYLNSQLTGSASLKGQSTLVDDTTVILNSTP